MEKLEELTEFECKYKTEEASLIAFKKLASGIEDDFLEFIYAEGPDRYYTTKTKTEASFARYRKARHETDPKEWLTFKKRLDKKRAYKRKEPNILVTGTPLTDIESALSMHGYSLNFSIYKYCHIYVFKDATIVFYTVVDEKDKHTSFIEIEVDEATIAEQTEEDAWDVIRKYEAHLSSLITYKNRMDKSLFDMYKKD